MALRTISNLINPAHGKHVLEKNIEIESRRIEGICRNAQALHDQASVMEKIMMKVPPALMPKIIPIVIAGQIAVNMLERLIAELPRSKDLIRDLMRGMPDNVTTEMDMALWKTAVYIKNNIESYRHFTDNDSETLTNEYISGKLPEAAGEAIDEFMKNYGMRGQGEIDMGRPRWREEPAPIMQVIKSYLKVDDPQLSPEFVFERGIEKANETGEIIIRELFKTGTGRKKIWMAKWLIKRIRKLCGLRESPKFAVVKIFNNYREMLYRSGMELAKKGILEMPDDIFFFYLNELKILEIECKKDWKKLVALRREAYNREKRRKRIPRIILSNGTCFYESSKIPEVENNDILTGSPVSTGIAEGVVRIVLNPEKAGLLPGEIMVCPATDPAWTPLFLAAGGLIMEVGGMMTHGSVVAREYGIPAVVGVNHAD